MCSGGVIGNQLVKAASGVATTHRRPSSRASTMARKTCASGPAVRGTFRSSRVSNRPFRQSCQLGYASRILPRSSSGGASLKDVSSFFSVASSFEQSMPIAYEIPFSEFVGGTNLGPYIDRQGANKDIANLLPQHFNQTAAARRLLPVEFASGDTG